MDPFLLLGTGQTGDERRSLERRHVVSFTASSGRVLLTDAFDRIWPEDVDAVVSFDLTVDGKVAVGVLWDPGRGSEVLPPRAAAIFVGRMDDWNPGDWRRLVDDQSRPAKVLCDGGSLLVFPVEAAGSVMDLQSDRERLSPLIRAAMEEGPQVDGDIAAVGSADGAFPCWGLHDAAGAVAAVMVDLR
ncbi:hypothetical protein [Nocardioides ultimimeridianus]